MSTLDDWKGRYSPETNTIYCTWNCGFFANCTITLWSLIDIYNDHGIIPDAIDFSRAFAPYKNVGDETLDVYPLYFITDSTKKIALKRIPVTKHDHHGHQRDFTFDDYQPFIDKYFQLSPEIMQMKEYFRNKYSFDPSKTITTFYRGTDKFCEVGLGDINEYLNQTERLLQQHPDFRVLAQSDQQQFIELCLLRFGDRCFYFEEDDTSIHVNTQWGLHTDPNRNHDRIQDGKMILSIVHLISESHTIVNNTGNMGTWATLFRGNATNVYQFDRWGRLIPPLTYQS
jgi:hypothetical protein